MFFSFLCSCVHHHCGIVFRLSVFNYSVIVCKLMLCFYVCLFAFFMCNFVFVDLSFYACPLTKSCLSLFPLAIASFFCAFVLPLLLSVFMTFCGLSRLHIFCRCCIELRGLNCIGVCSECTRVFLYEFYLFCS